MREAKNGNAVSWHRARTQMLVAEGAAASGARYWGGGVHLRQVSSEMLVHLEHRDLLPAEDGLQFLVSQDLALVLRVLEIVGFDVLPHLADHVWTGQGVGAHDTSQ